MKNVGIVLSVIALVAAAFWGGTAWAGADSSDTSAAGGPPGVGTGAADGAGRPAFANLTDEQMAEMQNMTQEERQAFMQEQGIEAPTGAPGGMRGGLIEGEVLDVVDDSLTVALESGGSQTVYVDSDTVIAYTDEAGDLAVSKQVVLFSEPQTDGVTVATVVVVLN